MRNVIFSILFLSIWSLSALAQDSLESTDLTPSSGQKKHGSKHADSSSKNNTKDVYRIAGQCIVQPGDGNLTAAPCTSLALKLEGSDSKATLVTRTDENGIFEFTPPDPGLYKIVVSSRLYEVVSPGEVNSGNSQVHLQIRQK